MWRKLLKQNRKDSAARRELFRRLQSTVSATATTQHFTAVPLIRPQRTLSSLQHHQSSQTEMKALMDTLQTALVSPYLSHRMDPSILSVHTHQTTINVKEDIDRTFEKPKDATCALRSAKIFAVAVPASDVKPKASSSSLQIKLSNKTYEQQVRNQQKKIQKMMNSNRDNEVLKTVRQSDVTLESKFLYNVFRYLLTRNPINSLEILRKHYPPEDATLDMYEMQCRAVADLSSSHAPHERTYGAVEKLFKSIIRLRSREDQDYLIPILLEASMETRLESVRPISMNIFNFLHENQDFVFAASFLERLLSHSRFFMRQLPNESILQLLADTGVSPKDPAVVAQALAHMFPFCDEIPSTTLAVKAILQMVLTHGCFIPIDIGTLEAILSAAARKGNCELGLLTWDLVEALGYQPTEGMYECMIQSFVMSFRQDHCAFACLVDMEEEAGFVPSRALIRSMSRSLRFSAERIDNAYRLVVSHFKGSKPTLSALNAVMSACAERGDVDRTFSILLDDFPINRIADPNQDSFSFAMESLAWFTDRERDSDETLSPLTDEERKACMDAAERVLDMIQEDDKMQICGNTFHYYIRVLINCGELGLAIKITKDALAAKYDVRDHTIFILVHEEGGKKQNFAVARELANLCSDVNTKTACLDRIEKWEKKEPARRR